MILIMAILFLSQSLSFKGVSGSRSRAGEALRRGSSKHKVHVREKGKASGALELSKV